MNYALITGASKGIGKCIARELAARHYGVLLVARDAVQLEAVAAEIRQDYGVQAACLAIDLSQDGAATQVHGWCLQQEYTVSILVNNAGYGLNGLFTRYSLQEHRQMMQVNMHAPVELCQLFLPMLQQQAQAYVLNIASSAAYQAVPYLTLYAASKAFLLLFSRGLRYELRKTTVSVTCVCPGATDTQFSSRAGITSAKALRAADKVNMQPAKVASIAVQALFQHKNEVITGFINKLGGFFVWLLPKKIAEQAAAGIYE